MNKKYIMMLVILTINKVLVSKVYDRNPYELFETDAQMAQRLENEEKQRLENEKKQRLENEKKEIALLKSLRKVIAYYDNNFISFIVNNEQVMKKYGYGRVNNVSLNTIALKEGVKINNNFQIKSQNVKDKENVNSAIILRNLYKIFTSRVPSKALVLNPGAQEAYNAIFNNGLLKHGEDYKELSLIMYFFIKEHLGELTAILNQLSIK